MLCNDFLHRNARRSPRRTALVADENADTRTYAQLWERSVRLGNALSGVLGQGDRVAVLSENSLEYVEAYYGIPAAGLVLTLLNYRLHPHELVWMLNDSRTRVLIVQDKYLDMIADLSSELASVERIVVIGKEARGFPTYEHLLTNASARAPRRQIDPDDDAWIMFTSGTTGQPKGVRLTHRNLSTALIQSALEYEPAPATSFLNVMPLCHIAGYLTMVNQFRGGEVRMMSSWDPERWMRLVRDHRVNSSGFAPTMMRDLLEHRKVHDYDLSSLEWMGYGASAMPADLLHEAISKFGPVVYSGMGMTELGGNALTLDRTTHARAVHGESHLLESVGTPMSLVDIRITDPFGDECHTGDVGEILVRGDQVTKGYLGPPELTAEAFTDEWFRTGDLARQDEEGFVYLAGRVKELIITGGENVNPAEVETVIRSHHEVESVAVIGVPESTWGETVVAVVVRRRGSSLTEQDVVSTCRSQLAGFKQPRKVFFVDALPRTVSGKVRKSALRDQYFSHHSISSSLG